MSAPDKPPHKADGDRPAEDKLAARRYKPGESVVLNAWQARMLSVVEAHRLHRPQLPCTLFLSIPPGGRDWKILVASAVLTSGSFDIAYPTPSDV